MYLCKFNLLFAIIWCLSLTLFQAVENVSTPSDAAVIECGNIHHIELQNFPQANASFSNGKCRLTCWIGNTILATDSIYEGRSCPEDSTAICRNGQCIGGLEDALNECGLKHNLDFHKMKDHKGTAFTNDQCMLKCVLDGTELSASPKHESLPCPTNHNGVCRNGACVTQSSNLGSTVTQTSVTQPSIDSFSPSKMKLLNISLESTNPSLNKSQFISFFFYTVKDMTTSFRVCTFYGNSTLPNYYRPQAVSSIPSELNKNSKFEIDLNTSFHVGNLYSLFANFYQSHKLTFGEHEDFVAQFPINKKTGEHVMDVGLRFMIVFSKD